MPQAAVPLLIASTVYQIKQTKEESKEAKRAERTRQRIADVKAARQRIQLAREARIKKAEILQTSENIGASGSAPSAAVSSVQSQLASNLSFLDQVQTLSNQASIFSQRAATARSRAGTAGAVAGLSSTYLANQDAFESIFS